MEPTKISWWNFPICLAYFIPMILLAYLVRRPNTYTTRISLLPILLALAVYSGLCCKWASPGLEVLDALFPFLALTTVPRALEFALSKERLMKVSEVNDKQGEDSDTALNVDGKLKRNDIPMSQRILDGLADALEVMNSPRGIGFEFGKNIYIPNDTRSKERNTFLRQTFYQILRNIIIIDMISTFQSFVPGLGSPEGCSIFFPSLNPIARYTLSTILHMQAGVLSQKVIQTSYDILTFFSVLLSNDPKSPTMWPPLFDSPWKADSLHDFWGRRWHQFNTQNFRMMGGYFGKLIAGDVGFVLGLFLYSGLEHELGFVSMGRGWDNRMFLFFSMNGVGIILERFWKKLTGYRVHGWLGTFWVYFWIIILGQGFSDSLYSRGVLHQLLMLSDYSPTLLLCRLAQNVLKSS